MLSDYFYGTFKVFFFGNYGARQFLNLLKNHCFRVFFKNQILNFIAHFLIAQKVNKPQILKRLCTRAKKGSKIQN